MQNKQNKDDIEKNRNYIKIAAILLVLLLVILAVLIVVQRKYIFGDRNTKISSGTPDNSGEYYNNNKNSGDSNMDNLNVTAGAPLIKINTDPTSYTVLVNREYPMPEDYVPQDLTIPNVSYSYSGIYEKSYMRSVAASAIEKMFAEAKKKKKFELKVVSAYRSYSRQKTIYENNVSTRGEEKTRMVSAQPGCSEHQTGLAVDVSSDTVGCAIDESFASCPEGKWIAKNCQNFGFIIRYPKGKSDVTGYSYEPWHLRYVGINLAQYIHKKKITLEEYYNTTTVEDKIPEDEFVNDTDVNAPEETEITAAPTPQTDAYINKTAIPVPVPSDTPVPVIKPTATPVQTPKPEKTTKPKKTAKPKATQEPEKTAKPKVTQEPEKTTKPERTKEPENTSEYENTQEPEETFASESKPLTTEKPASGEEQPHEHESIPEPEIQDGDSKESGGEETSLPEDSGNAG